MKQKSSGEFDLIARLAAQLKTPLKPGVVGIGDDAAAIPQGDGFLLLTCDIAVENRHFVKGVTPMADVGWKSVVTSVSDIAACGGIPEFALISLGVPGGAGESQYEVLYQGISEAAECYGFQVVGGNVTSSGEILVDCFMIGKTPRFVSRRGARPGDLVVVSGTLGDSEAGRSILHHGARDEAERDLQQRHLRPKARLDLAELLCERATAAIDISDSLASELHHLAQSSQVRMEVERERVPLSAALKAYADQQGEDPLEYALFGGEDYQLLFTVPPEGDPAEDSGDLTVIGKVLSGEGVYLEGAPLPRRGWDHLRREE